MNARSKSRELLRSRERELHALLTEWDPIGVAPELGGPTDEYECLLPMIGWLHRGITPSDLARRLRRKLKHHFGIDPHPADPDAFATRVFEWYWRDPLPGSARPSP